MCYIVTERKLIYFPEESVLVTRFSFELGVPQGIYVSDNYSKLIIVQNLSLPRFDF